MSRLFLRFAACIIQYGRRRTPNYIIGPPHDIYLRRWWLTPRNRVLNVYLHHFTRGDDDRALHDHPWPFLSLMLRGEYLALTANGVSPTAYARMPPAERESNTRRSHRLAGSLGVYRARHSHRVELIDGRTCWTLVITGPKIREWGFWCPRGWRHWREFTDPASNGSTVGPGCE